jgi:hypothetical protein
MKLAALVAVPLALAAAAGSASAGGYVSAGVGSAPDLGGDLTMLTADGRSGRVALGHGFGPLALEAGLGGFGVDGGTMMTASLSAKVKTDLAASLDIYARGGLERTWVRADGPMADLSGDGKVLGAGLELPLPGLVTDSALWLELDRQWMQLGQAHGTADTVMLGLRVGL